MPARHSIALPGAFLFLVLGAGLSGPAAATGFGYQEAARTLPLDAANPSHSTTVFANLDRWQSSGAWLRSGERYAVRAKGRWKLAPTCNETGPDGGGLYSVACWDVGGKTVPHVTHATLIGRIGHDGPPFAIGAWKEIVPDRDGILYLMVNDHPSWFGDNSGQVSAWVERVAPAAGASVAPRQDTTEIIIRQESVEGYDGSRESSTVRIRQGSGAGDSR